MKNPQEIRNLADQRVDEAAVLINAGQHDGAFYLAGYAIELELKAKCCERLGVPNLFDFEGEDTSANVFAGLSEIRRAFKTHDLQVLIVLSGLMADFALKGAEDENFYHVNSLLISKWNENCRYKQPGYCRPSDASKLVLYIQDQNGMLQWIRNK